MFLCMSKLNSAVRDEKLKRVSVKQFLWRSANSILVANCLAGIQVFVK